MLLLSVFVFSCVKQKPDYSTILNSDELLKYQGQNLDAESKYDFYKHLFLVSTFENLKNPSHELAGNLQKFPDSILLQLSEILISEYVDKEGNIDSVPNATTQLSRRQIASQLDSVFKTQDRISHAALQNVFVGGDMGGTSITSIDGELITINRDFGTGASSVYTYALIRDGSLRFLGEVHDQLSANDSALLTTEIKKYYPNFDYFSSRSGVDIVKTEGDYVIGLSAYSTDDPGCCPSISVRYKTANFKTITGGSVRVANKNGETRFSEIK